jgi:hypothetical protein
LDPAFVLSPNSPMPSPSRRAFHIERRGPLLRRILPTCTNSKKAAVGFQVVAQKAFARYWLVIHYLLFPLDIHIRHVEAPVLARQL